VPFIPIGLFLGRTGNFINSELYGSPTNSNWGVIFPIIDSVPRHPSMLYEAFLEGIVLYLLLLFFKMTRPATGILTAIFLIFYSIFRFCVEFVRVPDLHIGYIYSTWLTTGMILCIPMFFVGILIYYYSKKGRI
jgi:phosphatidylglycerol:prolipoprotein diacylglycerol transferase